MNIKLENFSFVEASLHWMYSSLTEIYYLNKKRTPNEIKLVNGPPFKFYRISLHYMFTMEYIKLMENDNDRSPQNHYASLNKLSNAVFKDQGELFQQKHERNLTMISDIKASALFNKIKSDRDKKFAHTDANYSNPFSFHSFSEEEIKEALTHIEIFKVIMENCTGMYDYSFAFQHTDNQTDNFIRFHTNYEEYYFANYLDAVHKGYH